MAKKRGDLAIAVTPVLTREFDCIGSQTFFVLAPLRHFALRQAILAEHRASAALADIQRRTDVIDALAEARRATTFRWTRGS